jgi:Icc protein
MPFSLPPLSRRRFLAGSVAAGLGLMSRRTLGAAATFDPFDGMDDGRADRLALLSDTHVSACLGDKRRGTCMADNFRRVTREILDLGRAPSHVLINGDLAYLHGRAGDYATAVKLLDPFREAGMPVHVAMGNHDSREHFRAALPPDAACAADPGCGRHVTLLELPRANVLMLDSLKTTNRMRGALGAAQLDWLAATLDANPRKPAVVMVHHPPETGFSLIRGGIADTSALFRVLSPRRQAKALVYGHTHVWSHKRRKGGLHLVNLPTTAYTFGPGQPNGWVDAWLEDGGAQLQLRALNSKHSKNGQRLQLEWRV